MVKAAQTKSKRAERRKRAKLRKKQLALEASILERTQNLENGPAAVSEPSTSSSRLQMPQETSKKSVVKEEGEGDPPEVEIDYVSENTSDTTDPELIHFVDVFSKFTTAEELTGGKVPEVEPKPEEKKAPKPVDVLEEEERAAEKEKEAAKPKGLSNKQRKLRDRLSIAQLKQVVDRPDLVELHDPNSADPTLLIHLKSQRNTVPVPAHWIQKRKYLQGKRGIEKPPFQLPQFIQDTGIGQLRQFQQVKDDAKSIKQLQRERMNPKMGKIDIEWSKLHDAFFKFQSKPTMTDHGDIYYAGKEYEVKYSRHRPGNLSKALREGLGMLPTTAPPWLHNMQRFGPPPSYPDLKIPGLNAPLPPGCKYGFATGLWGKPPVNENGYPLYGDPFGLNTNVEDEPEIHDTEMFGQLREDEEESDEEGEESEDESDKDESGEEEEDADMSGVTSVASAVSMTSGLETPPVLSIRKETGLETPDVDLRKPQPKQLYQVLEQKDSSIAAGTSFGSAHTYDVSAEEKSKKQAGTAAQKAAGRVQVALNLDELQSLDEMTIKRKYQEQIDAEKEQHENLRDGGDERPKKRAKKKKRDDISGFKF